MATLSAASVAAQNLIGHRQWVKDNARKLSNKYPNFITPGQLAKELPNVDDQILVFREMVREAQD